MYKRQESGVAFAVKEHGQLYEKGSCKICGRFGHEEAVYYEVIGYPPGWELVDVEEEVDEIASWVEEATELPGVDFLEQLLLLLSTKRLRQMHALGRASRCNSSRSN